MYQELDVKVGTIKEKEYYIRVDNIYKKNLLKHSSKFLHISQKLPMVCEPKDFFYSSETKYNSLGGYLYNDVYYTDHIFKDKIGYEEITKLSDDNIIVSLINGLSKTPYKVNTDTLEFIKLYGYEKNILIDDTDEKLQTFIVNSYKNNLTKKDKNFYRSVFSKLILEKKYFKYS